MQLIEANEAQQRNRDIATYGAWGTGLTLDQYLEREARLRAHPWARAALRSWLLVDDRGVVLASCETYRMHSFVDGAAGCSWGVASVFTEPALRGHGYASRLVALLPEPLRALDPRAHALHLYSDVGPAMYERAGYRPRPALDRIWRPLVAPHRAELLGEPVEPEAVRARFLIWPTALQLDWHRERERIYAELIGRCRLDSCGARADGGIMSWSTGGGAALVVLAWNGVALAPLLAAARAVAAAAGLERVVMWDQPGVNEGQLQPRVGSVPMLLPLDPRVLADDWHVIPRAVWV